MHTPCLQRWLFGNYGCTAYGYFGFLFGNVAICSLTAISVQRYLVVCRRHSSEYGDSLVSKEPTCCVSVTMYCRTIEGNPVSMVTHPFQNDGFVYYR